MKNDVEKQEYLLIEGVFEPEDAHEILMNLMEDKIRFHRRNDWSHLERFGEPDPPRRKRIRELQQTKDSIEALIEQHRDRGTRLSIHCDISVTAQPSE